MLKIAENEIHLWFVNDQLIKSSELLSEYELLLSESEKKRLQRFKFDKHRHQFLVARALVRSVLAGYLDNAEPKSLDFEKNQYGKPSLIDSSLKFNLSHTKGLIVLAVRDKKGLGVDIESLSRQTETLKVAERYFSPLECAELKKLSSAEQKQRFFNLWTLKEAYIKACGKGLAIPLQEFSFHFTEKSILVDFSSQLNDDPLLWRFWQYDISDSHRLALAISGHNLDQTKLICRSGVPLQSFEQFRL